MLPGITGMMPSFGSAGIAASYLSLTSSTANNDTYSFTNFAIGDAATDRRIIVAVHWKELGASHKSVTSATIGGVSATVHLQEGHTGGETGFGVALLSAIVPTGTTATIVVNFSGNLGLLAMCAISAIRVTGLANSTRHDTATDTTGGTADDVSATIDIPENGIVVAAFTSSTNAAGDAVTWTGATEEYDASTNGVRASLAWDDGLDEEIGRTITAAVATRADAGNAFVAVSWN